MNAKNLTYILIVLLAVSLACANFSGVGSEPTPTHTATDLPLPSDTPTPVPTFTIELIKTFTPLPSATPLPTETSTPTPTPTPIGSGSGRVVYWVEEENLTGDSTFDGGFWSLGLFDTFTGERLILLESDGETVSYYLNSVGAEGRYLYYTRSEYFETLEGITFNSIIFSYDLQTRASAQITVFPEYPEDVDVENLLNENWPDVSHDGRYLVFQSNRDSLTTDPDLDAIYIMDLQDNSIQLLTDTEDSPLRPRFSPDGFRVAYNVWDGEDWEIVVRGVEGNARTEVTDNDATDRYPEWSPDSTRLVFHSDVNGNYDLYEYELAAQETTRLTDDAGSEVTGSYSPDGEFILFTSDREDNYDIFMLDLTNGEENVILDFDGVLGVPLWIP